MITYLLGFLHASVLATIWILSFTVFNSPQHILAGMVTLITLLGWIIYLINNQGRNVKGG